MFSKQIVREISAAARKNGIEPAALLAVAEVESGGRAVAKVAGRDRPVIRFEGHYFDRRLSPEMRARARAEGLAAPRAGVVANPATQTARWRLLARAERIDRRAARESTSWGVGQVMGAHWAWLGYGDVDALVAEACAGIEGQVRLMMHYIEKAGLAEALHDHHWRAFARGYNGPAYRSGAYHLKLADAYRRHIAASGSAPRARTPAMLRRGMRGRPVRKLQRLLFAHGYPLTVDGAFGPATARAIRRFQRDHGLRVDAVAGPRTLSALGESTPLGRLLRTLWRRVRIWLRVPRA